MNESINNPEGKEFYKDLSELTRSELQSIKDKPLQALLDFLIPLILYFIVVFVILYMATRIVVCESNGLNYRPESFHKLTFDTKATCTYTINNLFDFEPYRINKLELQEQNNKEIGECNCQTQINKTNQ